MGGDSVRVCCNMVAVVCFGLVMVVGGGFAPAWAEAPNAPSAKPTTTKAPGAKSPGAKAARVRKADAARQELRPVRPVSVGEVHRISVSFARSYQFSVTGVSRPREMNLDQTLDLTAQAQVLAVNDHGNPTKVRMVVEKATFSTHGDRLKDELKRGEVLVFELQKGEGFVVVREQGQGQAQAQGQAQGGQPLHRDTSELFVEALPYARTALTDRRNEKFFEGGLGRKKPGEAWQADAAFLAALAPRSIKFDKSKLTGTMALKGVEEVAGRRCVKLEAKMSLPQYAAGDAGLGMVTPREFTFVDGTFDGRVWCYLPTEAGRQPCKWVENWRGTVTGRPKNGPGQVVGAVHTTRTIELADVGM